MKAINSLSILTVLLCCLSCSDNMSADSIMPGAGRGGSMAQFTVYNGKLYLLQANKLHTYSLEDAANPELSATAEVGFDAETLYPFGRNLFIGSQNGMHIYSLENPNQPAFVSSYAHITSCDPVVVDSRYAYVTLRDGSPCQWGMNELHIIDINNPAMPQLVTRMSLHNPQGLAINEGTLYVCNGDKGLVVMDVSDASNPVISKEYQDYHGYDVIFTSRSLMMIGETGLVQYDPSDPADLQQLSVIPVEPSQE